VPGAEKEVKKSAPAAAGPPTIKRADLDRVEAAMKRAGAEQPDLFGGDAPKPKTGKPTVPMPPPVRRAQPVSAVLVANTASASPFGGSAPANSGRACEGCGGDETPVPPTNLFYACQACYPETFGGSR
jgi:hypothetical protein